MYKKKLMKICLASALAVSMVSTNVAPVLAADVAATAYEGDQQVSIEFVCGDEVVVPERVYIVKGEEYAEYGTVMFKTAELEQYIPEGYQLDESYDGMPDQIWDKNITDEENNTKPLTVKLKKITAEEVGDFNISVQFTCEGVSVSDPVTCTVNGTHYVDGPYANTTFSWEKLYKALADQIPAGYELITSEQGDTSVEDGQTLTVELKKITAEEVGDFTVKVQFTVNGELVGEPVDCIVNGTHYVDGTYASTTFKREELAEYIPEGYKMTEETGDVSVEDGKILNFEIAKDSSEEAGDFFVDVRFMYNGCEYQVVNDCVVNGTKHVSDDATYTMFNYSELEEYVPEGYVMTMSGDVTVYEGQTVNVNIVPENSSISVGDFRVDVKFTYAGAEVATVKDCIVNGTQTTAGELTYTIFNYSELEEYVPKGYVLTPAGEVTAYDGETLEVSVAPEEARVSVGDFFVKVKFVSDGEELTSEQGYIVNGTQIANSNHTYTMFNYSELEEYVPAGYKLTPSGDVTITDDEVLEVNVEAVDPSVSVGDFFVNVKFVCDGEDLTPVVDCIINGTQTDNGQCIYTMFNYSELEEYVPEGYVMTVSGDVTVYDGEILEVNVAPKDASVSVGDFFVNVKFVSDGKEIVPAKDYIINGTQVDNGKYVYTMFNYSELKEYVPEGYAMTAAGDVTVYDGETLEVNLDKIQKESIVNVRFVYHKKVLASGDYFVDPDGDGIFNWSELSKYVPDGYKMLRWGNESVDAGPFVVQLAKKTNYVPGTPGIDGKKNGWYKVGDSDWSYYINNRKVVSDWVAVEEADPYNNNEVGTVWYHMNSEGLMDRGWIIDESGWKVYLLDSNGRMMHSQWVNAPASEELNRPAGLYKLTDDGAVQMNGWAESVTPGIYWFCNAGTGLFEVDNPASWGSEKLF